MVKDLVICLISFLIINKAIKLGRVTKGPIIYAIFQTTSVSIIEAAKKQAT